MKRTILFSIMLVALAVLAGVVLQPGQPAQGQVSWIASENIAVSATGTPGAVSASQGSGQPINGHVYALYLDFESGISTTTDITITQDSPALTILQLTDTYTDGWYYPAIEYTGSDGSGLSSYAPLPLVDEVTVAVGQTSSGDIVTVGVYWGE